MNPQYQPFPAADLRDEEVPLVEKQAISGNRSVSIAPFLSVRNGPKAIEFYQAAFGAQVLFRMDGENNDVVAELGVGDAVLAFGRVTGAQELQP